jgi:prepilin-type N-terminal cleavage/methylation domain-containing protein
MAVRGKGNSLLVVNVITYSGEREMKRRKGFTLIELMVVILIVAVLAAVLVPMMTSRLEAARWAEGKAGAGTIATALRAYIAEQGEEGVTDFSGIAIPTFMNEAELTGKYFNSGNYVVSGVTYDPSITGEGLNQLAYTIQVNPGDQLTVNWEKTGYTLDQDGKWVEL